LKEIQVAENLWALREQKKLSVATLASRAGLPIGLIMQYESGQRSIDQRHIARLARALYVEDSDIKLHSDPRPGSTPLEPLPRRDEKHGPAVAPADPPKPRERPRLPRPTAPLRPPAPARASQIAHLADLLIRVGRSQESLEAELGKPLAELDRLEASRALTALQTQLREGRGAERRRAYLPEAVDQFEHRYLTMAQEAGASLHFTLFDGSTVTGQIAGFGQYAITVRLADSSELTLNKLALVSYQKLPGSGKEPTA
jgi:transcriptional regulator with XRE-family HTH domain